MRNFLLRALLACLIAAPAHAQSLKPLDDGELAQVSGGDGLGIAAHISLNDPTLPGAVTDSRFTVGYRVDGQTTYIVIRNPRGTIDIAPFTLSAHKKPDGGDYMALTLPESVRYGNFGFESLSVQNDPFGPVTDSLGRFNINGTVTMQGQFRFWAH